MNRFMLVIMGLGAILLGVVASYAVNDPTTSVEASGAYLVVTARDGAPIATTPTAGQPTATLPFGVIAPLAGQTVRPDGSVWVQARGYGWVPLAAVRAFPSVTEAINEAVELRVDALLASRATATASAVAALTPSASPTLGERGAALTPTPVPPTAVPELTPLTIATPTIPPPPTPTIASPVYVDSVQAALALISDHPTLFYLVQTLRDRKVAITYGETPPRVVGAFDSGKNTVVLQRNLQDTNIQLVATVLAHEATHAFDHWNGRLSATQPDWAAEERAFYNAVLLWRSFYGPKGKASPTNEVEVDTNEGTLVMDDPVRFREWVRSHGRERPMQ